MLRKVAEQVEKTCKEILGSLQEQIDELWAEMREMTEETE